MLVKVKNGTPSQEKVDLQQMNDKAREFSAGNLLNTSAREGAHVFWVPEAWGANMGGFY